MEERELLHTDGLSVGYHGKELIKEIGISLKRGEIVTLIGPNGAGKSTILKTVAKQLQEICGSVYVENTSLCELPEKELAKKMSIVFTERITPELMTVADVVAMGRYPYTGGLGILTPKDEAVVAQCMDQVDLRRADSLFPHGEQDQLFRFPRDLCDFSLGDVHRCLPCLVERCIYIVVGATIIAQFWADASPLLFLPWAGFIIEADRGHAGWSGAAGRLDDSTVSRSIPIRRTGPRMAFLQSSGGLSFGCIQWSSTVLPVSGSGMPSRARMMAMRM